MHRRNFIKNSSAAGLSVTVLSFAACNQPAPDKKEKDLFHELKKSEPSTNSLTTSYDANNSFKTKKLKNDIIKTQNIKKEAIDILYDLKCTYHNFILEFDNILIENINLLKNVSDNFAKIGIENPKA